MKWMRRSARATSTAFIRVLDRFVEQSQFIIITHNKRTISQGRRAVRLTMEERGVSKLVGI